MSGARLAVLGAGAVGRSVVELADEYGHTVTAVADSSSAVVRASMVADIPASQPVHPASRPPPTAVSVPEHWRRVISNHCLNAFIIRFRPTLTNKDVSEIR